MIYIYTIYIYNILFIIYILDVLITCWFHVSPTQGESSQAVLFSLTPDVEVKEGHRKSTENNQEKAIEKHLQLLCDVGENWPTSHRWWHANAGT